MTIDDIYKKYAIPPHLQEHMFRVWAVAREITNHMNGLAIDSDMLRIVCLLHDVGNIVKFDKEAIAKYGTDDHAVTKMMLSQVGIDSAIIQIILRKSFQYAVEIQNGNDWLLKILFYADLRVAPNGIMTMHDRLDEIMHRLPKYAGRNDLVAAAEEVEKQLQEKTTIQLNSITNETAHFNKEELLNTHI